jgi:hypothetical protein
MVAMHTELSRKAASLPVEPSPGEADAVSIMVRWPDGTRQARRFRKQEPLQVWFRCCIVLLHAYITCMRKCGRKRNAAVVRHMQCVIKRTKVREDVMLF